MGRDPPVTAVTQQPSAPATHASPALSLGALQAVPI